MNIMSLGIGEGRDTYCIIQSIMGKRPIVCANGEMRKKLVAAGKVWCNRIFPDDGRIFMPEPITFEEFDKGEFNKSVEYIFNSIDEYLKWKGIKTSTLVVTQ